MEISTANTLTLAACVAGNKLFSAFAKTDLTLFNVRDIHACFTIRSLNGLYGSQNYIPEFLALNIFYKNVHERIIVYT